MIRSFYVTLTSLNYHSYITHLSLLHPWCSQVDSEAQPCTLPPTPPSPPPFSPAPQPPGSTPSRLSVAVSTPVGSAVSCDGLIAALWQVCGYFYSTTLEYHTTCFFVWEQSLLPGDVSSIIIILLSHSFLCRPFTSPR